MYYCHFSKTSDVCASQSSGLFEILVAQICEKGIDQVEHTAWVKGKLKKGFDGMKLIEKTPLDMFLRLRDLACLGYRVDPSTWALIAQYHPEISLGVSTLEPPTPTELLTAVE